MGVVVFLEGFCGVCEEGVWVVWRGVFLLSAILIYKRG